MSRRLPLQANRTARMVTEHKKTDPRHRNGSGRFRLRCRLRGMAVSARDARNERLL